MGAAVEDGEEGEEEEERKAANLIQQRSLPPLGGISTKRVGVGDLSHHLQSNDQPCSKGASHFSQLLVV